MYTKLKSIWQVLQKKMDSEKSFIWLMILVFVQFYGDLEEQLKNDNLITQDLIETTLSNIHSYDARVAFSKLSSQISWTLISDEEIQSMSKDVLNCFKRYFSEESEIKEAFSILLDICGHTSETSDTPQSVQQLIILLIGDRKAYQLIELCCGKAGLGMALYEKLKENNAEIKFRGEEHNSNLCDIAWLNLFAHHVGDGEIIERNILEIPELEEKERYDMILLDIPKGSNVIEDYRSSDPRITTFDKKSIYIDWMFIQDALFRLNPKGTAIILATTGALIRLNEEFLRKEIIVNDWLEAVITLPFNLYPKDYIGTELLIFNKNKDSTKKGKVIFIDISQYYNRASSNFYAISQEGIELAKRAFYKATQIKGISSICESKEIENNSYSFKPIQYIHHIEERDFNSYHFLGEIAEIVRGAQVSKQGKMESNDDIYFINIKDIKDDRIDFSETDVICYHKSICKRKYKIQQDDILITSKGTIIKVAIVEPNPPTAYISGNITMIRVDKEKYDPYVLFEYLKSKKGKIELERIQSGTTIRILSNTSLMKLKIPDYNLNDMRIIGQKLKENQLYFYKKKSEIEKTFKEKRENILKLMEEWK